MEKQKLTDSNSFSYRLEYAMRQREVCAADITRKAAELGIKIGSSNISQYRNGTYTPKQDKIVVLSRILAVPVLWLTGLVPLEDMDGPILKEYPNPMEAELLANFRTLNIVGKELAIRLLRTIADTQEYMDYTGGGPA